MKNKALFAGLMAIAGYTPEPVRKGDKLIADYEKRMQERAEKAAREKEEQEARRD